MPLSNMNRNMIGAVATLVGAIIGAGVLGLPYVFAKSGILLGLCSLVLIGSVVILMNMMLGEVTLRTKRSHMLPWLAELLLGKSGKVLMFLGLFVGVWGAMVAYLIGVGESIAAIYGSTLIFGINANLFFSLAFFITASALVYFGLRAVTRGEMIMATATVVIILALCAWGLFRLDFSNLTTISWKNIFVPYGVILFAMLGAPTVPEIRRILEKDKRAIKKALLIGTLIPLTLYALFAIVTVGITGLATTEIATIGLGNSLGIAAVFLGNLFAVFAMASSYVILGLALKDSITDGLRMRHWLAFLLTVFVPLIIFLLGVKSFINVIGMTGALAGALFGILIALMWREAKRNGQRKPEFSIRFPGASYLLIAVFSLGVVYTILNVVGVL
tara:strand:+ start:1678 stop:2841 length:1164 start_codon:yes stop_codon:yes gene_type:complete